MSSLLHHEGDQKVPGTFLRGGLDLWAEEERLRSAGVRLVAGVDEAGRGPLAGPVVVAAVILPIDVRYAGLRDSKLLTLKTRERLYAEITSGAQWVVHIVPAAVIDEVNILRATHIGMRAVMWALAPQPDLALVDGLPLPDSPLPHKNIVGGDGKCACIAAASVIAKITRDRLMVALDAEYPGYGFARHKGYAAPEHLEALHRLGPCPAHRRSFAPVRDITQGRLRLDAEE